MRFASFCGLKPRKLANSFLGFPRIEGRDSVVKVSVATPLSHAKGGQFVTHVKALPGNPYDGHTLKTVIPDMEAMIGNVIERMLLDKGLSRPQRAA